jgi:NAD(P)H-dependent FMN reductase
VELGIVIGSIRDARKGGAVGAWIQEQAAARATDGVAYRVIDLRDFAIPPFSDATHPMARGRVYDDPAVQAWSDALDAMDGYVFVTAEYNHGVPGAFKNAVDHLGPEFGEKTVAFVSYGADGGVRATEQWRQILANFSMYDLRPAIALGIFTDFDGDDLALLPRRAGELDGLLGTLERVTAATAGLRASS